MFPLNVFFCLFVFEEPFSSVWREGGGADDHISPQSPKDVLALFGQTLGQKGKKKKKCCLLSSFPTNRFFSHAAHYTHSFRHTHDDE